MTADDIKAWMPAVLFVWNIVLTASHFLRKPGEDAAAAVSELREQHGRRLVAIESNVVQIQTELEHMPTSEELAKLEGSVKQIAERTEAMTDSVATMRHQLNRIEDYLLSKNK